MPVFCTQCGTQNVQGACFCDQCGARLKQPGPPAPGSSPPPGPAVPAYPAAAPVPAAPTPAHPAAAPAPAAPAPAHPAPAPAHPTAAAPAAGGATRPLSSDPLDPARPVARLVVLHGEQAVREHMMYGTSIEIGRWDPAGGAFPDVDLSEDDPQCQVSRRHARLNREGDKFFITDQGSTNGTYVGRSRLSPHTPAELAPGSEIILGRVFLRFETL